MHGNRNINFISISQTLWFEKVKWLVNDEWEKIEKEVFVAKLKYCLGI
jgi:hypothetical protein